MSLKNSLYVVYKDFKGRGTSPLNSMRQNEEKKQSPLEGVGGVSNFGISSFLGR